MILCVDPGVKTGVAYFNPASLIGCDTVSMIQLLTNIENRATTIDAVIYEDSRKIGKLFSVKSAGSKAAQIKIARNVGEIDGYCRIIEELCLALEVPCCGVSPKAKGGKLNAEQMVLHFGNWPVKSNQHERDAAMLWFARPMHLRGKNAGN